MQWLCEPCSQKKDMTPTAHVEVALEGIAKMLKAMGERMERIEEQCSQKSIEERIEEAVEKKVRDYMKDNEEKERKKLNIIVYNLPESSKDSPDDKKQEDLDKVRGMIEKITDVPKTDVTEPVRLGKIQIGQSAKPRLLRLKVKTEEQKIKIIREARNLNKGVTAVKDRIFINHDTTFRERERVKELKTELKRRAEDGERDLVIDHRELRIVRRSPGPDSASKVGTGTGGH